MQQRNQMDKKDLEFQKRIQATFRIEAEEHLRVFTAGLIELEKARTKKRIAEIIETMFREIHSLKGSARSVDQKEIESVCHPMESLFSALKHHEITLSPMSFDILYKAVERLSRLISTGGLAQSSADRQIQNELIRQLKETIEGSVSSAGVEEPKHIAEIRTIETAITSGSGTEVIPKGSVPLTMEVVRIPISKLDPLLLQAEEMIHTKIAADQRIKELKEIDTDIAGWKTDLSDWKGHRSATNATVWNEWLEGNEAHLNKLESQLAELTRSMERDQYNLDRMVNDHLGEMKQVLMLPVSSLVESFPAMVREISREQNKETEFIIRGAELEIDKRILEEFKDPLIHLIRNSLDHGIGTPQERTLQNKTSRGTIILAFIARESGKIEITISDDGKGIDKDHVLKAAIKSGNISSEAAGKLDPKDILSLIYQSGVTTSSIITDFSGRGLGLSIVREKVEKLDGRISVETEVNRGTTFHILLPMTLATFRGIMVRMDESMFLLPTVNVERVMKVEPAEIKTIENHETIRIDDRIISLVDFGEVLGLPEHKQTGLEPEPGNSNQIRIVVLVSGENHIAVKVDDVVGEQQVLVKGLGKLLKRVRNISGATVLGSGKVIPVIHVADLIKSAIKSAEKIKGQISPEKTSEKIKKILVAEDSITARTLIKNILETAGYQVSTAVDGTDAFTRTRSNEFDLIVSDVDMPHMNGFELTAKIRNDKKLSDLPIVLLTALESREDREHGIEVGADAYIIKSSFDQTNLLEIIKKLI
jgi:two-component system, chemotaxis family, sensor kinase CheA